MRKISLGVDIGGSHITTVAIDLDAPSIINETLSRRKVDSKGPAEVILTSWTESITETLRLSGNCELLGIGFAMPGPFDYPGGKALFQGVKKFDALYGMNIGEEIKARIDLPENCQLRFVNDATCFAIGEAWMGRASEFKRVMAITLGTGFGSAFLEDGVPIETGDEVPPQGCVYHLPFGASNADDNFSTRWFLSRYQELTGKKVSGVVELIDQYNSDVAVQYIFREFGENLGIFLSSWLKLFKAECLVLGGNIAKSQENFLTPFRESLIKNGVPQLEIYLSALGEDAALIGSARLSDTAFYHRLDLTAYK